MRGLKLLEMALFNTLVRAARNLKVDMDRTEMQTSFVARNDEGLSASADDVVQCLSDALLSIDLGRLAQILPSSSSADPNDVLGYVSTYKEQLHEIAALKNVPGEMKLKSLSINVGGNKSMKLWLLCTDLKLFERHLKLLLLVVRRVYSATDEDDLRLILSRILWIVSNAKQQDSLTSVLEQFLPSSGNEDIRTQIDSFLTSDLSEDDIFGPKECVRANCTRVAAPNPDPKKRHYSGSLCCNNETCSRECTWHENGIRCSAPRYNNGKWSSAFCGSAHCMTLYTGTQQAFKQVLKARKDSGEMFIANG